MFLQNQEGPRISLAMKMDGIFPVRNRPFFHISPTYFRIFGKIRKRYGIRDEGFWNQNRNGDDVFPSVFLELHIWPKFYWISARPMKHYILSRRPNTTAHLVKP
jgi:hypothetical protein